MAIDPLCLRCPSVALMPTKSPGEIHFYECRECGRRYAREPGGPLTERWLGPLSLVLYGVIFSDHPQERADDIATQLRDRPNVREIAAEIRLELKKPSQPVREILPGMRASEVDLREFLAMVAAKLVP